MRWPALWLLAGVIAVASCSPAPTAQQRAHAIERAALAPLQKNYAKIVTAFDISGTRLDLAINANAYIATGDDTLSRFRAQALRDWRDGWRKAHPGKHAVLTLRLMDYINRVWATEHTKA